MLKLSELQHWFGIAVVRRQLDMGELEQLVVSTEQLSAQRRMGIYAEGYRLRLLECMRAEYSCLCELLGQTLFDQFALNYLEARPSTSYTLFELGDHFPAFLAATRPPEAGGLNLKMPEQLAALERYRVMSIRGQGLEQQNPVTLDVSQLLMAFDGTFELPDTSFVMASDFALMPCIRAMDSGASVPFPEEVTQHLLVYRSRYRIYIEAVEPWQAAFLQRCQGQTWGELQQIAVDELGLSVDEVMARLVTWIPEMVAKSVLCVQPGWC